MPFPKDPPPGFQGLRRDLPVTWYRRNLPHARQVGATYFTTYNLNDSLPRAARDALAAEQAAFDRCHPPPHSNQRLAERARKLAALEERWLDAGHGACPFKQPALRTVVRDALRYFDAGAETCEVQPLYHVGAGVIMPNHVHLLMRPLDAERQPLEKVLQSRKRQISRELNRLEQTSGSRWFEESYDRIVRDSEHLWQCVQYIGANGRKAGLPEHAYTRWVCPAWREAGWDFM